MNSKDLFFSTNSVDELKKIIASNDNLKSMSILPVQLREAMLIYQQQAAKEGELNIKVLLKEYKEMTKMEGVDPDLAFRYNIEMALLCYRTGNMDVGKKRNGVECVVWSSFHHRV